jgi:hypothetical protein
MTFRAALAVFVTGLVVVLGGDVRAQGTDEAIPSPVEQALMERACVTPATAFVSADAHDACLHARLIALRADFGTNLGRLSAADRRKLDTTCGQVRGVSGRDGYVDCLASELAAIRNRMPARAAVAKTEEAASSPSTPVTDNAPQPAPAASSSRIVPVAALVSVLAISIAVPLLLKKRRARICVVCKARVDQPGAMCPSCRHEAADAQRRAAAERIERQAAQAQEERLERERHDEEQRRLVQEAEAARLQEQERAQRQEEARRKEEEDRRLQAEIAERQRRAAASGDDAGFDPYAVLGVPRDATFDAIREAHEQARSKYDFEHVADLGFEIQQHYKTKAQAVDRAFQMLAESHQHTASC